MYIKKSSFNRFCNFWVSCQMAIRRLAFLLRRRRVEQGPLSGMMSSPKSCTWKMKRLWSCQQSLPLQGAEGQIMHCLEQSPISRIVGPVSKVQLPMFPGKEWLIIIRGPYNIIFRDELLNIVIHIWKKEIYIYIYIYIVYTIYIYIYIYILCGSFQLTEQFAVICFSIMVGKNFAKLLPTVPNWVKVGSFRAPWQLICSASVDWAAQNGLQNRPKTGAQKQSKHGKIVKKKVQTWGFSPEPAEKQVQGQAKTKLAQTQAEHQRLFISYLARLALWPNSSTIDIFHDLVQICHYQRFHMWFFHTDSTRRIWWDGPEVQIS